MVGVYPQTLHTLEPMAKVLGTVRDEEARLFTAAGAMAVVMPPHGEVY